MVPITVPFIAPDLTPFSISRCLPNAHPIATKIIKNIGSYNFHGRNLSITVMLITPARAPINVPNLCFLPRFAPMIGRAMKRIMNKGKKARIKYILSPCKFKPIHAKKQRHSLHLSVLYGVSNSLISHILKLSNATLPSTLHSIPPVFQIGFNVS